MSNVGLITYHRTSNYGGVLQAYALQRVLEDLGHAPELVDYWPSRIWLGGSSVYLQMRYVAWHLAVKRLLVGLRREKRSEEFRKRYLHLSKRQYRDAADLLSDPPRYDAYITGSDQVWNPRIHGGDASYYLAFAPEGRRRIAYAASFGVSRLPQEYVSDCREWLRRIDKLSVREVEGQRIVQELTGRTAPVLVDPTLLLTQEQWSEIASPYDGRTGQYILSYYMPGDEVVNRSITSIAKQVSSQTGWRSVCIGQKEYMRLHPFRHSVFDAGPREFLGLFKGASFVVTNSFHGVIFAITFGKPFLVPVNRSLPPERALTSRITTLVQKLALEHRLLAVDERLPAEYDVSMDFSSIQTTLHQERTEAVAFLRDALQDVNPS